MFLGLAIALTIVTAALVVTLIFLRKRIKLVIVLFKEAGKAAASMPLILFEPILVSFLVYFIFIIVLYRCAFFVLRMFFFSQFSNRYFFVSFFRHSLHCHQLLHSGYIFHCGLKALGI